MPSISDDSGDDRGSSLPGRTEAALLAFTIAAGSLDAMSYLGIYQVFPANMTGNTVLMAIGLAEGSAAAAAHAATALAGFSAGVALATITRTRGDGPWLARVRAPATFGSLALVAMGVWWALTGTGPHKLTYALIALAAFAMGLQSSATHAIGIRDMATTYMTGTLTTAVEGVVGRILPDTHVDRQTTELRTRVWLFYLGGAAAGAFAEHAWHAGAVAIPAALASAIACAGWRIALAGRRRSRGHG